MSPRRQPLRPRQFSAFISYSRAADGRLAPALQAGLQGFAKPWYRLRAIRVFRDDASLSANPALWPSITHALDSSAFFLLLGSPGAAGSAWVEKEVRHWLSRRGTDGLLLVLTEGQVAWDEAASDFDWGQTDSLPRALAGAFEHEPRFVDLRWARSADDVSLRNLRFRDCVADLAAPLHGRAKDELIGEDVRQHRRALRLARGAAAALLSLATLAVALAVVAAFQRDQAKAERGTALIQARLAQSRELAARAERDLPLNPARGMRLALQAVEKTRSRQALAALRSAVLRSHVRLVLPLGGNDGDVQFSRDSRFLLTADANLGPVRQWSLRTGRLLGELGHGPMCSGPDGRIVVTIGGGEVAAWSLQTRKRVAVLAGADLPDPESKSNCPAFTPDGRLAAAASNGGSYRVWEVLTGRNVAVLPVGQGASTPVAFTDDGRFLVVSSSDGNRRRAWETRTWQSVRASPLLLRSASLSEGATFEASIRAPGRAVVTESRLGVRLLTLHDSSFAGARAWSVSISRDHRVLASLDGTGAVWLWNAQTGKKLVRLRGGVDPSSNVVVSADGEIVAAGLDAGKVQLWRAAPPVAIGQFVGHTGNVEGITLSADNRLAATWSDDGTARVWAVPRVATARLDAPIVGAALTRSKVVAVTARPHGVQVWIGPLPGGAALYLRKGKLVRGAFGDFELSPTGALLALRSVRGMGVEIWETATGRRVATLPPPADIFTFSSDGSVIATMSFTGKLALWEASSGRQRASASYNADGADIYSLGVGARGTFVGMTDAHDRLVLWQTTTNRFRTISQGGANQVWFSPDGRRLLSNTPLRGGVAILGMQGTRFHVLRPAFAYTRPFSGDGRLVAASSGPGQLNIWDAHSGVMLAQLNAGRGNIATVGFDRRGTLVATAGDSSDELRVQACGPASQILD